MQISPFGLSTICHFPPDVTDTSQQPAWFFEQVLQVYRLPAIPRRLAALNRSHCSVPSLCSKVSFLLPTIRASSGFCFDSPNGMHWPNFAFIRTTPSCSFSNRYGASAINWAIFNETPVVHSILVNYLAKPRKGKGGKWLRSTLAVERKNHNWA